MTYVLPAMTVALAASLAACGSTPPVMVNGNGAPLARQITAADHCGLTAPGLVYIDSRSDLASFRQLPGQNLNLSATDDFEFDREHLVVVAAGRKPTGGYSVTMTAFELSGDTLTLAMLARDPAPKMMVPQVITTPCAVVAVNATGWETLEITGEGLPDMTRSR